MAGEKICLVCGEDVSNKPRTKDAQGRYVCKACVEAKRASAPASAASTKSAGESAPRPKTAAKPAQVASSGGEDAILAALVDDATKDLGDPCPQCGVAMKKGAAICTRCGFNPEIGKTLRTRVMAAEREKKVRTGPRFQFTPSHAFIAVVASSIVFVGLSIVFVPAIFIAFLIVALASFASSIMALIYGVKDGHTGWVIASFFVPLAFLYLAFGKLERPMVKALYGASIIGSLVLVVGVVANPDLQKELDDEETPIRASAGRTPTRNAPSSDTPATSGD